MLVMSNFIHKSRIVIFRQTSEDDLSFVMETEREPENAQFITQWSFEQHRDVMNNETMAHWIIQAAHDNRRLGYIILDGIDNPNKSIEFKRSVVVGVAVVVAAARLAAVVVA